MQEPQDTGNDEEGNNNRTSGQGNHAKQGSEMSHH